jgi:hypothetical protein
MSLGSAWRYAWRSAWVLPVIAVVMFVVAELLGEPWPTIVLVLCVGIPFGLLALLSVMYAARWLWRATHRAVDRGRG